MREISSGLVAVRIDTDGYPLVRLSDAEAIIAQKDTVIERLKSMLPDIPKAERECKTLEDWRFRAIYFESEYAACSHGFNTHASKQAERIKELESEVLEQCRINGMGAERELALLGQIERQSAALKLAKEALEYCDAISSSRNFNFDMGSSAIAAIDALKGE